MRRLALPLLFAFALAAPGGPAPAQTAGYVVATRTIYPGDRLTGDMLRIQPGEPKARAARSLDSVIGKIARRTFLIDGAIALDALGEPATIANGAFVQLVYEDDGLIITASGQALGAASPGDAIRVRNTDSGLVVTGVVNADGTVRIRG